jgi:hypothetical protein
MQGHQDIHSGHLLFPAGAIGLSLLVQLLLPLLLLLGEQPSCRLLKA